MNEKNDKTLEFAAKVKSALEDIFSNQESDFFVNLNELENGDLTPFLTGMCIAHLSVLRRLCRLKGDLLDCMHTENVLIVQYLIEHGKVVEGNRMILN